MGEPGSVEKRAGSWAFDIGIGVVGVLLALGTVAVVVARDALDPAFLLTAALAAPIGTVMYRFPLVFARTRSGVEVGFESAVLVFLVCLGPAYEALAVWFALQLLSHLTNPKRRYIRFFNFGLAMIAGTVAVATMRLLSDMRETSPRELLAVGAGCAAYFLVDHLVSAFSVAVEERSRVRDVVHAAEALPVLGVFVAIDSLGYLGALVFRELDAWASILLAVPVATILVASRALTRGFEHRRRLEALFDAAAEAQLVPSRGALESLLRRSVRAAVANEAADLRASGPGPKEVGVELRTADADQLWLVAPALTRARESIEGDRRALEALAALADEAFTRLALTAEMAHLARHDALTSLPNRTLFHDRVEQALIRGRRGGGNVAVLYLDLDGFKSVNDRFGHAAGDDLLQTVAERLSACVRAEDSVARLGGDEFAIVVEHIDDLSVLDSLCERLLRAMRREISVVGHEVVVGTSIGVSVATHGDDAAGLMRDADMAMYRAKALGKDRYFVYEPSLREESLRELELVEALRRGIHDELVVYYQPVVDLRIGQIGAVEALVRWQRDGTLVPPDVFIGVAERSGLIGQVGERVLAQVVEDAPILRAAAGLPLTMGVNVSAPQFRDPRFLEQVRGAVAALGDSRLVLEMTETLVVSDDSETAHALDTLKALGAKLAIDDFGVGFSSIGYLQHLPVDIVKIDRSFTADVDVSPRAAALVESISVMATALNLQVVAEGIERVEQMTVMRDIGIPIGQGYLFGRPQPRDATVELLKSGLSPDVRSTWVAARASA